MRAACCGFRAFENSYFVREPGRSAVFEHVNSNTFVNFACDLETGIRFGRTEDDFFSKTLLDLLWKHFDCSNIAITAYKDKEFAGGLALPNLEPLLENYKQVFRPHDVFTKYISKNLATFLQNEQYVVKVTDYMSGDEYAASEYLKFYNAVGVYYVAVIIFENHRITFCKDFESGDFDKQEEEVLGQIHSMLHAKYRTFRHYRDMDVIAGEKNKYFDDLDIGVMVFDEHKMLLESNQKAIHYATLLFRKKNINMILQEIIDLFEKHNLSMDDSASLTYKGYEITLKNVMNMNECNQMSRHYCAYIKQAEKHAERETGKVNGIKSLSGREFQILEAFCNGLDYNTIAGKFGISVNTVHVHIKNIYKKTNTKNQRALLRFYDKYNIQNV